MKFAFVVPRYGAELGGGAEALMRSLALDLVAQKTIPVELEIWTTCAKDHRTWENAHAPGVTIEDNIVVRRFQVDPRDVDVFLHAEFALQAGRVLSVSEQLNWLGASVNSKELYRHIAAHGEQYDALFFAPYLFGTTFWGSLIYPDKSVLIPCLHDEAYAYQDVFRVQMRSIRGIIGNAAPELELAAELYGRDCIESKSAVVGMTFVDEQRLNLESTQTSREDDFRNRPFLLYSGRKEEGKNLHLLIDWFEDCAIPEMDLLLIGAGEIGFRKSLPANVYDLGFVSADERARLMAGAVALIQLSTNESFSIVMMEAWLLGTPCIVHSNCRVTRDHVVSSGGGAYVGSSEEFKAVIDLLYEDKDLRCRMGQLGKEYVCKEYSSKAVIGRFFGFLRKVGLLDGVDSELKCDLSEKGEVGCAK